MWKGGLEVVPMGEDADEEDVPTVDRGALLYQAVWWRHRWHDPALMVMGLGFLVVGTCLEANFIYLGLTTSLDISAIVLGSILGWTFTCSGIMFSYIEHAMMPFKVYENGFTLPVVPFWTGVRRREVFIPRERITGVSRHRPKRPRAGITIEVRYLDADGEPREALVSAIHVDNLANAGYALYYIRPDVHDLSLAEDLMRASAPEAPVPSGGPA